MKSVLLDKNGLLIHGKRTVLLCASLFYFRIPRAEWEDRIVKLKAAGYNCVDVYFPWNFHETTPGEWDFTGEKDVDAYLDLLKKHGMYVVARPGPYICSEWDGGAIPAWILTDPEVKIRQNDPKWIAAVREWYNRILPQIVSHQIDCGGTVILVQIENELDFFDCPNPRAYMEALRGIARQAGVTVPIFGCAGQANVEGATGWAGGVDVSYNFYGDVCDPSFGEKIHYYAERMGAFDRPLLISETSCDHLLLRRELAAGAKLLGPYNQVGGTNFGLTGSVNNWGPRESPGFFITAYYATGGMIGSAGELSYEYFEGRRFSGMVNVFGEALANARSVEDKKLRVVCGFPTDTVFYRLNFSEGGSLVCVPNLGTETGAAEVACDGVNLTAEVPGHSAPFFPFSVPLALFGAEGTLLTASGELENAEKKNGELVLTFWSESGEPFAKIETSHDKACLTEKKPAECGVRAVFQKSRPLRGAPLCGVEIPAHTEVSVPGKTGAFSHIAVTDDLRNRISYKSGTIQCLERCGVYRGAGNYRFRTQGKGVLLLGGSDIVTVRRDGKSAETYAGMGAARWFAGCGCYEVTASVWGHSNFADARQPALMLDSPKGLSGAVDVRGVQELESNWFFSYYEGGLPDSLRIPQRAVETVVSINSWNTTRTPLRAVYRKMVCPVAECDAFFLELRCPCAEATLYVDGQPVGLFNPFDPFLDASSFLRGKESAELELCVTKRDWSEPVGTPVLYSGRFITTCDFAPFTEAALTEAVAEVRPETKGTFPLQLEAGSFTAISMALSEAPEGSCYLRVYGKNILTAVWAGDRLVGRALLWDGSPRMCGERELIYLPQSYREGCQSLRMLVAALSEGAELTAVETVAVD